MNNWLYASRQRLKAALNPDLIREVKIDDKALSQFPRKLEEGLTKNRISAIGH